MQLGTRRSSVRECSVGDSAAPPLSRERETRRDIEVDVGLAIYARG